MHAQNTHTHTQGQLKREFKLQTGVKTDCHVKLYLQKEAFQLLKGTHQKLGSLLAPRSLLLYQWSITHRSERTHWIQPITHMLVSLHKIPQIVFKSQ